MQAPKCRVCGAVEWQHVCIGGASAGQRSEVKREAVRVKKPVNRPLTPALTPFTSALTGVNKPCAECERLASEVKQLKRALAEAHTKAAGPAGGGESARNDMAAYMRKRRAKLKAKRADDVTEFKG